MLTLQPRRCGSGAWKAWCRDGLRLVLRCPDLFCAWIGLCLLRGWLITLFLPGADFVECAGLYFALALPEPCIAWMACGLFSRRMRHGTGMGLAGAAASLRSLVASGCLWRMLLLLLGVSLVLPLDRADTRSWGLLFSLGLVPAVTATLWFYSGSMRINLSEWTGLRVEPAGALSRAGRRLNFRSLATSEGFVLAWLWTLLAWPVGATLGGQAVLAGVTVFGVMFSIARTTCAMHDIFNTGEKVEDKARQAVPVRRLAAASP